MAKRNLDSILIPSLTKTAVKDNFSLGNANYHDFLLPSPKSMPILDQSITPFFTWDENVLKLENLSIPGNNDDCFLFELSNNLAQATMSPQLTSAVDLNCSINPTQLTSPVNYKGSTSAPPTKLLFDNAANGVPIMTMVPSALTPQFASSSILTTPIGALLSPTSPKSILPRRRVSSIPTGQLTAMSALFQPVHSKGVTPTMLTFTQPFMSASNLSTDKVSYALPLVIEEEANTSLFTMPLPPTPALSENRFSGLVEPTSAASPTSPFLLSNQHSFNNDTTTSSAKWKPQMKTRDSTYSPSTKSSARRQSDCLPLSKSRGHSSTMVLFSECSAIENDIGDKPFVCGFARCNVRFARNHDLKRHERIHTGEKQWMCQECRRTFGRRDALTRHTSAPGGLCKTVHGKRGSIQRSKPLTGTQIGSLSTGTWDEEIVSMTESDTLPPFPSYLFETDAGTNNAAKKIQSNRIELDLYPSAPNDMESNYTQSLKPSQAHRKRSNSNPTGGAASKRKRDTYTTHAFTNFLDEIDHTETLDNIEHHN